MSKFDKNTIYAVKCILLGARIHDVSALCDKTDQAIRYYKSYKIHKNHNAIKTLI